MLKRLTLLLIIVWLAGCLTAFSRETPLPPDQAFQLNVTAKTSKLLVVTWKIASGYYLYKERLQVTLEDESSNKINRIDFPLAKLKPDVLQAKEIPVFSGNLRLPIYLQNDVKSSGLKVRIAYQGCSSQGFCYPPMQKTINVRLAGTTQILQELSAKTERSTLLTDQNGVKDVLKTHNLLWIAFLFVGLGLLLSFTPCVLPMMPIIGSIVLGQKQPVTVQKAFYLSLTYVLGMAITYASAGILAALVGSSLQASLQKPVVLIAFSMVYVLLACSLFGWYELRLPTRWGNWLAELSYKHEGGTYAGVLLIGIFATLIVSPCVTAPLIGVLIYISETGDALLGGLALFCMGIGMGLPLLAIGVSAGKWIPKTGPWMLAIKKLFGILLLSMAIWLFSRVGYTTLSLILWGLLFFGAALFVGLFLPKQIGWHRLNRSLGLCVGVSGILLLANGGMSGLNLERLSVTKSPEFTIVQNITELQTALTKASAARKPVLLDFYARWCDSCVSMDRKVFALTKVKRELSSFVLLRADLTQNDDAGYAMMKRMQIIAPPTVLFFNLKGQELKSQRINGEVSADEFLSRLAAFNSYK